jgi:hypothetical protein
MAQALLDANRNEFHLRLTMEEAAALDAVLSRIGPTTGEEDLGESVIHEALFDLWFKLHDIFDTHDGVDAKCFLCNEVVNFMPFRDGNEDLT